MIFFLDCSLGEYIDFINQMETKDAIESLQKEDVFVMFDGTTRLGEGFAIVLRAITEDYKEIEKLVNYQTIQSSMSGEEMYAVISDYLMRRAGMGLAQVIGAVHDGASANGKAMRIFSGQRAVFTQEEFWNLTCLPHFLNLVGDRIDCPILEEFLGAWKTFFAKSHKARAEWKQHSGVSFISSSATRWWSEWDQVEQIMVHFRSVQKFLEGTDLCRKSSEKMVILIRSSTLCSDEKTQSKKKKCSSRF